MPELPEVENVKLSLSKVLKPGLSLEGVQFLRPDLRFPIPKKQIQSLIGKELKAIDRRAKYLLFDFGDSGLISHLGMTGQWSLDHGLSSSVGQSLDSKNHQRKVEYKPVIEKHEHLILTFQGGIRVRYIDPRRFGYVDFWKGPEKEKHPFFESLGIEPLSETLTVEYLKDFLKGKSCTIKAALLDQAGIAGLGNIYVCEALFKAKVRPQRKAKTLKLQELKVLIPHIKEILSQAIELGGSSIRDYKNSDNQRGDFQSRHLVYGREGELCRICHTAIKNLRLSGRSSFWCPSCQK